MRNGTRLIKMKNPWGTETFKGDYSDSRMSSSVQRELGHTKGNDGVFYMSLDQYYDQVKKSTMNFDTSNWKHDYFLKLNDNGRSGVRGSWDWCGQKCRRYTARVKNTSFRTNKVWVGAHTWRKRSYPDEPSCKNAVEGDTHHSIYMKDDTSVYAFQEGERWVPGIELGPGEEMEYTIELDLSRS